MDILRMQGIQSGHINNFTSLPLKRWASYVFIATHRRFFKGQMLTLKKRGGDIYVERVSSDQKSFVVY